MQTGTLLIDSALYDSCCSFWDAYVAEACRCARRRRPLRRPPSPDAQPRRRPLRTASVQPRLQRTRAPRSPPPVAAPLRVALATQGPRGGPTPGQIGMVLQESQAPRGPLSPCGPLTPRGAAKGLLAHPNGVLHPLGPATGVLPPNIPPPRSSNKTRRRSASVPPTQPRCRCLYRRLAPCVRRHAAAANASDRATPPADQSLAPASGLTSPSAPATRAIPAPVPALAAAAAAAAAAVPDAPPRSRVAGTPAPIMQGHHMSTQTCATAQGDDGPSRWGVGRNAAMAPVLPRGATTAGGGRRGPRGQRGQRRERAQRWRRGQRFDGPPPPPLARPMVNFAQDNTSHGPGVQHFPFQATTYDWQGASCYFYDDLTPPEAPFYFFPYWPSIPPQPFDNYFCLDQPISLDFLNQGMSKVPTGMDIMMHTSQPEDPPPTFMDQSNGMAANSSTLVANVTFRIAHLAEFFSDPFKEELFLELADATRGECECFEVVELSDKQQDDIEPMQVDGTYIQHIVQEDVLKNFIRNLEEENNGKDINTEDCDTKNGYYTDYRDSDYEWYQSNAFKKRENGSTGWDYRFTYTPTADNMNGMFMVDSMKNYQDIWLKQ